MYNPLAEVGQAKQPLPQARGWLSEICGAGRFLHVTFMILCWFAWLLAYCLLSCFVWPHAMAPTIASGQKKNRRLGLFVFVVSSSVRLFICLIACLFVCLVLFSFVSFSVSLLFDDRCSDKYRNLDEYFGKKLSILSLFVCAFKTHNFWGVISGSDNDCQCFYTTKTSDFMIFL